MIALCHHPLLISLHYCHWTVNQADLVPLLVKHPSVLKERAEDLRPKVDYLYESLGGSPDTLRLHPQYLSSDLDVLVRPRTEYLRLLGIDPMYQGMDFLLRSSAKEFSSRTGKSPDVFKKFTQVFVEQRRSRTTDASSAAL